ncbi:MAG: peroxidase [Planctomycetes bacterium]|nr:peroxidase [Planctomycetota bacterium]
MPPEQRDAWLASIERDWRAAALVERERALCEFAERLTLAPASMREADVLALRAAGLDDRAIHDLAQVVAYFNYINRIADALHVELEPEMPPDPREA